MPSLCWHKGKVANGLRPGPRQRVLEVGGAEEQALAERLSRPTQVYPPGRLPGRAATYRAGQPESPGRSFPGTERLSTRVGLKEFIRRVSGTLNRTPLALEAPVAGFRENATSRPPTRAQSWTAAAPLDRTAAITTIHSDAGAFITTIVIITLPAGYSTG